MEYSVREKTYQGIYVNIENKTSQLNASSAKVRSQLISERKSHSKSQCEFEAKYSAKIQSLKSKIKTLKREATLTQKALSVDKVKILSLKTKVVELEGKLENLKLDLVFYDSNIVRGVIEELAQINSFAIERLKDNLNLKNYEIECMEKRIEAKDIIYKWELDILSLAGLKLIKENAHLQELLMKKDNEVDTLPLPINDSSCIAPSSQSSILNSSPKIISVGGAKAVPLLVTVPIIASSLMSSMLIYSILILLLIAIIWLMVRKKLWNIGKKSDQFIQTSNLHLWAYSRLGYIIKGQKRSPRNQIEYRN